MSPFDMNGDEDKKGKLWEYIMQINADLDESGDPN